MTDRCRKMWQEKIDNLDYRIDALWRVPANDDVVVRLYRIRNKIYNFLDEKK